MKRREFHGGFGCLLAAWALGGCSGGREDGPDRTSARAFVEQIADAMLRRDVGRLVSSLDERVADSYTAEFIEALIASAEQEHGAFQRVMITDLKPLTAEDLEEVPGMEELPAQTEGFAALSFLATDFDETGEVVDGVDLHLSILPEGSGWKVVALDLVAPG